MASITCSRPGCRTNTNMVNHDFCRECTQRLARAERLGREDNIDMDPLLLWAGPSDVCTTISSMHSRGWLVDVANDRLVHLQRSQFIPGPTFRACLQQTNPQITFSTGLEDYLERIALPIPG